MKMLSRSVAGALALALCLVLIACVIVAVPAPAADPYGSFGDTVSSPANRAVTVTPDDTAPLADIPKALYVGTGGTIVMRGKSDSADRTWKNVPTGAFLPFRAEYIRATGTTAADILALY